MSPKPRPLVRTACLDGTSWYGYPCLSGDFVTVSAVTALWFLCYYVKIFKHEMYVPEPNVTFVSRVTVVYT
jgi:hypothetical protein